VTATAPGGALEAALTDAMLDLANGALALDPATPARLAVLGGRRIRLDVELPPPLGVRSALIEVRDGRLLRARDNAPPPHVIVTGTPLALGAWLAGAEGGMAGSVRIDGDGALLAELRGLLGHYRPDPGGPLERVIGRDATRRLLGAAEMAAAAARTAMEGGLDEARRRARRTLATRRELHAFLDRLDELGLRVDRLSARVSEQERRETPP
jgi:ubiquinone biosynthesis protein UbiJ